MQAAAHAPKRVAFVVNNVAFFVSHRLPIALKLLEDGYRVDLYTGHAGSDILEQGALAELSRHALCHRRLVFKGMGVNPLVEGVGLMQLVWYLRKTRPSLVHCVSPKGVLYGGIACRLARTSALVLAISGMGYVFTDRAATLATRLLRALYEGLFRFVLRHKNKRIIVQNRDDLQTLVGSGFAKEVEVRLIQGSGVDLHRYINAPIERKAQLVVLPARMLVDKGVVDFAEAARLVRAQRPDWRFVLAGTADYRNPSAIAPETIQQWQKAGWIEWLGHVEDMAPLFHAASIVCLPSYREGMPKALLEAAAAGCAIVTTDVTGCREAIVPGVTGDLAPARDSVKLATVIQALIDDPVRRESYGLQSRALAVRTFGIDAVVGQTVSIYREILQDA